MPLSQGLLRVLSCQEGAHKSVLWGGGRKVRMEWPTNGTGMASLAIQMINSNRCYQSESDSSQHLSPGVLDSRIAFSGTQIANITCLFY